MQRFRLGRRPYFICWFRSWPLREEGGVMYCTSSRAHYQTLKQKGRDTSCKRWLCSKKQEVYFLIDETQSNEWCSGGFLFVPLLKNNKGRMITTIGAGVLEFQSMSARFHRNLIGTETFPSSHEMLVSRLSAVSYNYHQQHEKRQDYLQWSCSSSLADCKFIMVYNNLLIYCVALLLLCIL